MKKIFIIAFFVLIALYTLFQARFLILGPRLTIEAPANGAMVDRGVILVSGVAEGVSHLSLDDRQIYTDTEGRWQEKLVAHEGVNTVKLTAIDRFGRETTKFVRIVAK